MRNITISGSDGAQLLGCGAFGCLVVFACMVIPAAIITLAWNELLVSFFPTIRTITFWEGLLISLVLNLIFRPFRLAKRG